MDHPRSRGVYTGTGDNRTNTAGSSPLARGLRFNFHSHPVKSRIIPARAGFTISPTDMLRDQRDHPRSRGVYPSLLSQYCFARGSSPLARGLPYPAVAPPTRKRIIPARAGFTLPMSRPSATVRDHPRSRGVYRPSPWEAPKNPGSSPLARGLLRLAAVSTGIWRIIPARAGFTPLHH